MVSASPGTVPMSLFTTVRVVGIIAETCTLDGTSGGSGVMGDDRRLSESKVPSDVEFTVLPRSSLVILEVSRRTGGVTTARLPITQGISANHLKLT